MVSMRILRKKLRNVKNCFKPDIVMAEEKKHTPFYVINEDINRNKFCHYDVIPYLIREYEKLKNEKKRREKLPETFEEFKEFVKDESQYQFWSRCEYEIVLSPWVSRTPQEKIDVYWQIMMNHDIVTRIFMENVLDDNKNN